MTAPPRGMERPVLTFRVGVTGDRAPAMPVASLAERAVAVLRLVRALVERQSDSDAVRAVYAPGPPSLRLISPLAEGADRIVADAAIKAGFALEVVLPFGRAAYEATFQTQTSLTEFAALLASAGSRILTLDGASDDRHRAQSYGAAGRMVVRSCDLLVAIWDDGKPPRGRGGTADTVQYALRAGVPVWCIHATRDEPPRLLTHTLDLSHALPGASPPAAAEDTLRATITRTIRPPQAGREGLDDLLGRLRRCLGGEADPMLALYAEHGRPHRRLWRAHAAAMGALRAYGRERLRRRLGLPLPEKPARPAAPAPAGPTWRRMAGACGHGALGLAQAMIVPIRRATPRTDASLLARLAGDYQHQYRTSYFFVLLCGTLALCAAAVGLAFPDPDWVEAGATVIEAATLTIIAGLVVCNQVRRWHERYISYRMLRELLRLQDVLHALGWSVPGSRVDLLGRSTHRGWVAWLFAALARSAPMPTGCMDPARVQAAKREVDERLLDGQLRFHEKRHEECEGAGALLSACGRWLFWFTLLVVMLKLALVLEAFGHAPRGLALLFGLLSVLLPAASAAFFGIKAYEELEVLAEQSEEMEHALSRAKASIARIDPEQPLASQLLGTELFETATLMLSDVSGWAQLFRLKAVEA